MPKVTPEQSLIAVELLKMFPPKLRESVIKDPEFRNHYGLTLDATIVFRGSNVPFKRSKFYAAVRALYKDGSAIQTLRLDDGREVRLSLEKRDGKTSLLASAENGDLRLPSFWFLSPDPEFRRTELEQEIVIHNLPDAAARYWRERLAENALDDEEVDAFTTNLQNTPQEVAGAISNEVENGEAQVSVLVPRSMDYYERLVGELGNIGSIESYIAQVAPNHFARLIKWDFDRGLTQCLSMCAHPSFAPLIEVSGREEEKVNAYFGWLEAQGDRFAQVAGFEVGIGLLPTYPSIEPHLLGIARQVRDDEPSDEKARIRFSANLFVFVDGDLSRIGIFRGKPPFWRRLAAIAQASLIERQLLSVGVQSSEVSDWATQGRGQQFYMQTLADLRLEPRWLPDLMTPEQLKLEFLSRLLIASEKGRKELMSDELIEVVAAEGPESLGNQMKPVMSFLPGPIEGASEAPRALPEDIADRLREPPGTDVLEPTFFAGIVNSALLFRIETEMARRVAELLREVKYRLSLGSDTGMTFSLLSGLAVVAAVTRTPELAHEIRTLSRVLMRRDDLKLDADNQMRIALIACASTEDLSAWCQAVGEWLLEIAHGNINAEMAGILNTHLYRLCQIEPQLWRTCARADAALAAAAGAA